MCHVFKVSRSGFYAWRQRKSSTPTRTEQRREERFAAIEEAFQKSRKIFGYRKLHAALRTQCINCSLNTVHSDCQHHGIKSIVRRKYRVQTTDSKHNHPVAKNVLNRDFTASRPNKKWVTDITYVATHEGWLFVVAILDLFSRKVIGYAMADHMRTELVVSALRMALNRGRKLVGDIWLHTDRGVQFASEQFRDALQLADIAQSMSRKGNCWDNAPCESWFGKLRSEWIYPQGVYATREQAKLSIIEYIEMFYNSKRLHQTLGYKTPNEFEANYFDATIELTPCELTSPLK